MQWLMINLCFTCTKTYYMTCYWTCCLLWPATLCFATVILVSPVKFFSGLTKESDHPHVAPVTLFSFLLTFSYFAFWSFYISHTVCRLKLHQSPARVQFFKPAPTKLNTRTDALPVIISKSNLDQPHPANVTVTWPLIKPTVLHSAHEVTSHLLSM